MKRERKNEKGFEMELTKEKKLEVINNIRGYIYKGYLHNDFDEVLGEALYCAVEECGSTEEEVQMIKDSFCSININGILTIIFENEEEYRLAF